MQTTQPEFQRQLRSLFAVLRTLIRQSVAGHETVEDYAAHLEGRIGALARVHEMLMRAPAEGIDLLEIVCGEFLAQAIADERFRLRGPDIRIASESAAAIALTFHELATNALTHGALSTAEGRTEVSWDIQHEDKDRLRIRWHEHWAGPAGTSRRVNGFGTELMERMLPYELSAVTAIAFANAGVRVEISIPASAGATIWRPGSHKSGLEKPEDFT